MYQNESLKKLDAHREYLYSLRPFSGDEMKKIRDIFRIEYNYHSNHIEGNSLTMQETRSLLMMEAGGSIEKTRIEKKKRDIMEMKAHDDALQKLGLLDRLDFAEQVLKSDLVLSHALIRDLNKMILVENYKKRVIDENGDQFFTDVIVGQYKEKNNHVKRRDGTMFFFAGAHETQSAMQDLIDRFNQEKNNLHPVILATIFHYKFIRIHPFDDGNGRTCRLLVNMILMHYGYPLLIVPSDIDRKDEYYDILEYTDKQFDDLHSVMNSTNIEVYDEFINYLSQRLMFSIDAMVEVRQYGGLQDKQYDQKKVFVEKNI